jgi:hypothetical protein
MSVSPVKLPELANPGDVVLPIQLELGSHRIERPESLPDELVGEGA